MSTTLLDGLMPRPDVSSRHAMRVEASPVNVYEAARSADLGHSWLVKMLLGLRGLPSLVIRWFRGRRLPIAADAPGTVSMGGGVRFVLIAEEPAREFVLGIMGRFWTPSGGLVAATVDQLTSSPPAGLAQAMWSFRVEPDGSGCLLITETRVRCGDDETRRRFRRYWRLIAFSSALIRRSVLREIRRAAEAGQRGQRWQTGQ